MGVVLTVWQGPRLLGLPLTVCVQMQLHLQLHGGVYDRLSGVHERLSLQSPWVTKHLLVHLLLVELHDPLDQTALRHSAAVHPSHNDYHCFCAVGLTLSGQAAGEAAQWATRASLGSSLPHG